MDTFRAIKDALDYAYYALSAKEAYDIKLPKEEISQLYELSLIVNNKLKEMNEIS
ncbi:MAG TPA: hypothetical protein PLS98_09485 [Dictyoglomaceae bacterium]|nr:hypothetical protein [Dictyoglomaceae bacterium]